MFMIRNRSTTVLGSRFYPYLGMWSYVCTVFILIIRQKSRSSNGGGTGRNFVPVLGGDGTKKAPPGDIFDQPPGEMSLILGKLADHVGGHVVLSPEGAALVTSPGTESSNPPPSLRPHWLDDSKGTVKR